ncbi:MAG: GNAT family N-acetyltransferase [Dehalococcoidia bacterium]
MRDDLRPGDLGSVVRMHRLLYGREEGLDTTFEAYVALALAEFALARDREGEQAGWLWLAELDEQPVGSVGLVRFSASEAQLRWFLISPAARGQGLGRRLLREVLDRARATGYQSVFLWTYRGLDAAAHLYQEAGFRLSETRETHQWGREVVIEQRYDLQLPA